MNSKILPLFLGLMVLSATLSSKVNAAEPGVLTTPTAIDWPSYMARQDAVWERLPARWNEGAFVGNGLLGVMVWRDGNALCLELGRTDIVQGENRLPLGQLLLQPKGQIQDGTARLDLWNARVTGTIKTDRGSITWRIFTHAEDEITVLQWTATGGEHDATVQLVPAVAANPRKLFRKEALDANEINPPVKTGTEDHYSYAVQDLNGGGSYATAFIDPTVINPLPPFRDRKPPLHRVYLTTQKGTNSEAARDKAREVLRKRLTSDFIQWQQKHYDWWHTYFQKSFLSVPDGRLENFYWMQLYKLASGTRSGRPLLDLMGPWFRETPWPRIWWNLNTQLTYWPVYASNHLDIGESLPQMLDRVTPNLIQNVPKPFRADSAYIGRASGIDGVRPISPAYALPLAERDAALQKEADSLKELGNLTWVMHNVWLQYRYSMDDKMARETLYPLLRRSVSLYLHLLETGDDGYLHLPQSHSPEYKSARDTNYDLALLRWGLKTLPQLATRLKIREPERGHWREIEQKLTPYPTGPDGMLIGRDVPLSSSHRHFSHLLMFYPLRLLSHDVPENRELLEKSVAHWLGFKGALQGYSYTGGAAMMASMGKGDEAYNYLNSFLNSFVQPNTMYLESGPVIETPLSAAASLQEMVLQSWSSDFSNTIRVFPAVPTSWKDVSFSDMRTQGAFLVSGVRREGRTAWIRIQSLKGEPLQLKLDAGQQWNFSGPRRLKITPLAGGLTGVNLKQGESIVITPQRAQTVPVVSPVATKIINYYGVKNAKK